MVLAVRTPQKDTEGQGSPSVSRRAGNSLEHLDVEWVTEHARQVDNEDNATFKMKTSGLLVGSNNITQFKHCEQSLVSQSHSVIMYNNV